MQIKIKKTTPNVCAAILKIRPELVPGVDFQLFDDGFYDYYSLSTEVQGFPSQNEIAAAGAEVGLDAAKADGRARISAFAKSKRALIAGTTDDAEIAGWSNKLRIAQAIIAGTATDGEKAVFQAEITARGINGETLAIFTQKVIANAGFFSQAVGLIDGLKRKAQDSIVAAKTPDEVAAVLNGMKTQAEAAFAQLMQGRTT
jgi:hypothetical protein